MSSSAAEVVVGSAATGHRGIEDDNTIILWVAGVRPREGSISEEAKARPGFETDRVQVQSSCIATSEGPLHSGLLWAKGTNTVEPVGIECACRPSKGEGISRISEVSVQPFDLVRNLAGWNVATSES